VLEKCGNIAATEKFAFSSRRTAGGPMRAATIFEIALRGDMKKQAR